MEYIKDCTVFIKLISETQVPRLKIVKHKSQKCCVFLKNKTFYQEVCIS